MQRPRGFQRALGGRRDSEARRAETPAGRARTPRRRCRRNGVVAEGLAAMDEPLVIGGGEIESAAFRIGKERPASPRPESCANSRSRSAPTSLQELEQRIGEKRVVVEIGMQMRTAVLVGCEQPSLLPQRAVDEIDGGSRGVGEIRTMQHPGGDGESSDHERIPRGQDLFIARRARRATCARQAASRAPSRARRRLVRAPLERGAT